MENASRAFLDAVRKLMRQVCSAIGATVVNPVLLTAAEKLQYAGYLRREETNAVVLALWKEGVPIKQIVRRTGCPKGIPESAMDQPFCAQCEGTASGEVLGSSPSGQHADGAQRKRTQPASRTSHRRAPSRD